eukprot:TRINITY_DN8412_c0_g1_i1.p1 TRINITY_DN8412_c0_g1~~TRINITY_DN8412_c0_g1_i1.p1  ORF type:complete len:188 (-),score=20.95 TRINITY_DN8412_c0_g1_i1:150-713(-)
MKNLGIAVTVILAVFCVGVLADAGEIRSCITNVLDVELKILESRRSYNFHSFQNWDQEFADSQRQCDRNLGQSRNKGYECFRQYQRLIDCTKEFDNYVRSQPDTQRREAFARSFSEGKWATCFAEAVSKCVPVVQSVLAEGDECYNEVQEISVSSISRNVRSFALFYRAAVETLQGWSRSLGNCNLR